MGGEIAFGVEFSRLRPLWREAFGDGDEFLDLFEREAYSPERTACILDGDMPLSALYWFDCECEGERVAYLYAIATKKERRGEGLCRRLMLAVHEHLRILGYVGCILVPAREELFSFYSRLGYKSCVCIDEFEALAGDRAVDIRELSPEEFMRIRKGMLPSRAVIQEGACIDFLKNQAKFYTGPSYLLTARKEGDRLFALELLGDRRLASDILCALRVSSGTFRSPGRSQKFAMHLALSNTSVPAEYFAFAFD